MHDRRTPLNIRVIWNLYRKYNGACRLFIVISYHCYVEKKIWNVVNIDKSSFLIFTTMINDFHEFSKNAEDAAFLTTRTFFRGSGPKKSKRLFMSSQCTFSFSNFFWNWVWVIQIWPRIDVMSFVVWKEEILRWVLFIFRIQFLKKH